MIFSKNKGFTLIELLVVIAVIGLMSGIVFTVMRGAAAKARDTVRKQDIGQLEKALLLYADSYGGQFPSENWCDSSVGSCGTGCPCNPPQGNWSGSSAIWQGIVGNKIMAFLPKDPINNSTYYYLYEPCCNQDCGGGRNCTGRGCCEYAIEAVKLETAGGRYTKWGRQE